MPEMLWAVLLADVLPRRDYLAVFRRLIEACAPWFKPDDEAKPNGTSPDQEGINYVIVLDHSKLADLSEEQFSTFFRIATKHPLSYGALRPLLLAEAMPGYARWKEFIGVEPTTADWQTLMFAVARVHDHQSEKSTDVRWFKVMLPIVAGRMSFPESMRDEVSELFQFPNKGDMRSVRPRIRSLEVSLRRTPPSKWVDQFWAEMLDKTNCIDPTTEKDYHRRQLPKLDAASFFQVRREVIVRFAASMTPRRTDAKLDSAFGMVLYALSLVEEMAAHGIQRRIVGQLALRALVDANITLRYLINENKDELWLSHRVYGAGQAKLAFLKAHEADELPAFIDKDALFDIANEDRWHEYLEIDTGHWANANLRTLAIKCGAKDTYDRYYGWPSAFVHAHWGPIRDTNFVTCHNPVHRLHRIPRTLHRPLSSVEADALDLANEMIVALDALFPGDEPLPRLTIRPAQAQEADSTAESAPNRTAAS